MASRRRNISRPLGERRYKKMFILAVEGKKTEPQYFDIFNKKNSVIHVFCLKTKDKSSSLHVLKKMKQHLKEKGLKKSDEAWLVVDKDQWTDKQLRQLHQWSQQDEHYGFALSNPKFEFWLLLHFEDGDGVSSSRRCSEKLARHLPDYNKVVHDSKISETMIDDAIRRARKWDNPPCSDWPHKKGTTVYKLVESILESHRNNEWQSQLKIK